MVFSLIYIYTRTHSFFFILFGEPLLNDDYFLVMHLNLKSFSDLSIVYLIFYMDELYF
jgi:hypothetical protein